LSGRGARGDTPSPLAPTAEIRRSSAGVRFFPLSRVLLGLLPELLVLVAACQGDDDPCESTRVAEARVEACVRGGFTLNPELAFGGDSCNYSRSVCAAECVNHASECASLDCVSMVDPNAPPWTDDHVSYCRCVLVCTGDVRKDAAAP